MLPVWKKTPDNRNGDHLPSPSMKQLNKRILPASLTKPTYQNQQTFHKSALNNPPKTPATQNNSTIITQPFPIKSSTSNVETYTKTASSNPDCFARGFLCRNSRNANTKDTVPTFEPLHHFNGSMVHNSSTTFMASNKTNNLPTSHTTRSDPYVPNNVSNTPTSKSDHGHYYPSSNFHVGESSNSTAQVRRRSTSIANDAEYFRTRPVHCNTATQTNVNGNDTDSDSDSDQSTNTDHSGSTSDEEIDIEQDNHAEGILQCITISKCSLF
jgi:hypothetical protein